MFIVFFCYLNKMLNVEGNIILNFMNCNFNCMFFVGQVEFGWYSYGEQFDYWYDIMEYLYCFIDYWYQIIKISKI